MVRQRAGRSSLGCLVSLLILAAVVYFGVNVGEVAAGLVTLQRDGRHIEMESDYYEHIELPGMVKEVHFNPHAEGIF